VSKKLYICVLVIFLLVLVIDSYAELISEISSYEQNRNVITFICGQAKVNISLCTDDMFRVRLAQTGKFYPDSPWVVLKYNWLPVDYKIVDKIKYYQIETKKLYINIAKKPFIISVIDKKTGKLVNRDNAEYRLSWDKTRVRCDKDMLPEEKFYGFGERFGSPINKRGKDIPIEVVDAYHTATDTMTYVPVPFFMSSVGYGIFFNNSGRSIFRLGTESPDRYSFESPTEDMDYYFIYGPEFKHIIELYTELTGRPKLPPLWTFGFGIIHNSGEKGTKLIADKFREIWLPCDIIGMDDAWADCNGNFMWQYKDCEESPDDCDTSFYPNPVKMLEYVRNKGFKTWVWIVPNIMPGKTCGDNVSYGIEKGFFVKQSDNKTDYGIKIWAGTGYYPDFTNSEAKEWFKSLTKNIRTTKYHSQPNVIAQPDVFKTDDGEYLPYDARLSVGWFGVPDSFNTGEEFHNIYPMLYNNAVCDATRERIGRGFTLYRSGGPGSQRSPTLWGGDQSSTFEAMKLALNAQMSITLSGFSFWNHDIGGCDDAKPTDELAKRWIAQYGMFLPQPFINDWRNEGRLPWQYSEDVQNVLRKYCKLHYRLIPYIYTYAYESTRNGSPMTRPLIYEFQSDTNTHLCADEFLYGEYILVAPVYVQGATNREIYLPEGKWTDYWTETVYEGKQMINYSADVDRLPILIRAGAIIPMWPEMNYVGEKEPNPITLDIFPDSLSSFIMYEDDGTSSEYENGAFSTTKFECIRTTDTITVRIGERKGAYKTMPSTRYYFLQVHNVVNKPIEVKRGSLVLQKCKTLKELETAIEGWYYDTDKKIAYIKPLQNLTVEFNIIIRQ